MKKFLKAVLFARDSKTTLILALAILSFIVLGCSGGGGSSSKNKPIPSEYYGGWTSSDGTSLQIKSDGTGYYRSGGTTINGAAAELDETGKIIKLSFLGITAKEFKIDEPPKNGTMKLDGMVYKNGFVKDSSAKDDDSSDSDSTNTKTDANGAPSNSDLESMTGEVMTEFANAVETEDFDGFRNTVGSPQFKDQFSNDFLKDRFKVFIEKKEAFKVVFDGIEDMKPTFNSAPVLSEKGKFKLMDTSGSYATKPVTTFKMQFVKDTGDWKILGIDVHTSKSN